MGDVVTFEHEIFARREIPVHPKIVRIRKDVNWQDLANEYVYSTTTMTAHNNRMFFVFRESHNYTFHKSFIFSQTLLLFIIGQYNCGIVHSF